MAIKHKSEQYVKVASYEGRKGEIKKVVLLYSGDLDTSTAIKWIKQEYKAEVIALTVDIGQKADLEETRQKALKLGATKAIVVDARQEFANDYIAKAIKANAMYQGRYYLSTPLGNPLLAKWAVKIAAQEGADSIAHGCTGKGNDQIRIEGTALALNPDIKLLAPVREWGLSRAEQLEYCESLGVSIEQTTGQPYSSYDDNMWGVTSEGGEIDDPARIPPLDKILQVCLTPERAKNTPEYITIEFAKGLPVAVDGVRLSLVDIIYSVNQRAAQHAVGIVNLVKDRIIGLKIRGLHEAPAAETIITAHKALESYTSTRLENEFKSLVDEKWTYLCYGALWYEPLMDDLNAFEDKINDKISGTVTVKLYKGHIEAVAVETPHSVYDDKSATFTEDYSLNQNATAGFIENYTFQMKLAQGRQRTALLAVGGRSQKLKLLPDMKALDHMGYKLYATYKTYKLLKAHGVEAILVHKINTPELKPNLVNLLDAQRFDLIINIPTSKERLATKAKEKADAQIIRQKAVESNTPLITSAELATATIDRLERNRGLHR